LRFVKTSIALGLLALIMLMTLMSTSIAFCEVVNVDNNVYHNIFSISPGNFVRIEFYASKGSTIRIYIHVAHYCICVLKPIETVTRTVTVITIAPTATAIPTGEYGIDVEIIRPDGSIEYPKYRILDSFNYSFTARESGKYIVYLDNTFSSITKYIDIVIAGFPQSITTIERTITVTSTTTTTSAVERTVIVTSTITETTISTSTVTTIIPTTLTIEREGSVTPTMLSMIAIAIAVIAIAIAFLVRRR